LARTGSGSACRSIPAGFVEWKAGRCDDDSFAYSIAAPEHWDLVDCIVLVSQEEKRVASSLGHSIARTSLLQPARVSDTPRRLDICRKAIQMRDLEALAEVVELDSNLMHAVMFTCSPPLMYWQPATMTIMQTVQSLRKAGMPACYTIDAGPNVHVFCDAGVAGEVASKLCDLPGVIKVFLAHPGEATELEKSSPQMGEIGL
jgi:diphosphomevalonate decarboxylase